MTDAIEPCDYRTVYSDRKTLLLQLEKDGSLTVRAPYGCSKTYLDAFVRKHASWTERARERRAAHALRYPELTEAELAALKAKGEAMLPEKIAVYSEALGVRPASIRITKAQTRFGSCSQKGSLCFSAYLFRYPEKAIDYVVVHELAHLRHLNHSAAFYETVASVLPDYKEREALLRF